MAIVGIYERFLGCNSVFWNLSRQSLPQKNAKIKRKPMRKIWNIDLFPLLKAFLIGVLYIRCPAYILKLGAGEATSWHCDFVVQFLGYRAWWSQCPSRSMSSGKEWDQVVCEQATWSDFLNDPAILTWLENTPWKINAGYFILELFSEFSASLC